MANLILSGSTSGSVTLSSPAVSGTTTLTLPTTTDTLVGKTTTDTLTNKTLTSPVIAGTPTGVGVLTAGTSVASTSGTSIDFTSIPSWVKRITVMFNGVSTNGISNLLLQIGAGSVTTSGYVSCAGGAPTGNAITGATSTAGYLITSFNASTYVVYGNCQINLLGSNTWIESGNITSSSGTVIWTNGGSIALGGTLDRVRITTVNGTDAFDAGSINILYE
jgi:hypothetical protein